MRRGVGLRGVPVTAGKRRGRGRSRSLVAAWRAAGQMLLGTAMHAPTIASAADVGSSRGRRCCREGSATQAGSASGGSLSGIAGHGGVLSFRAHHTTTGASIFLPRNDYRLPSSPPRSPAAPRPAAPGRNRPGGPAQPPARPGLSGGGFRLCFLVFSELEGWSGIDQVLAHLTYRQSA